MAGSLGPYPLHAFQPPSSWRQGLLSLEEGEGGKEEKTFSQAKEDGVEYVPREDLRSQRLAEQARASLTLTLPSQ